MRDTLLTEPIALFDEELYNIEFCANLGHCLLWRRCIFDACWRPCLIKWPCKTVNHHST